MYFAIMSDHERENFRIKISVIGAIFTKNALKLAVCMI